MSDSAAASSPAMHRRAVLWLVAGTAAWGLSFPVQKMLTMLQQASVPEAGSWFLTSWIICLRSLYAAGLLMLWRPKMLRGMTRAEVVQGVLLGMVGGLGLILQADGLAHTQASTSAFITQAYCVILPLWHCLSRKIFPDWRIAGSTVLVLWGIAILSGLDWKTLTMGRGEWETLGSALAFTFQIILLERPKYRGNRMMPVTLLMFLGFALWSAPVAILAAPRAMDLLTVIAAPAAFGHLTILAVFCTVFAYGVMNAWQPHVSATEAGLIYCIEPVCTAVYALFLPGLLSVWTGVVYQNETITATLLKGGVLITAANLLTQWRPKPRVTVEK
ncbi:MAG: DMT family transporter [Verrucomicrobiota bacterium]